MDIKLIKKLIKLVKESGIHELEIEEEGKKIKIKSMSFTEGMPHRVVETPSIDIKKDDKEEPQTNQSQDSQKLVRVVSPMVGTFYRAPSPESPPFVNVGDRVKKGQVLCIIEAMKLMNEIESEYEGTIKEILVKNGCPVQYGDVLFVIELD